MGRPGGPDSRLPGTMPIIFKNGGSSTTMRKQIRTDELQVGMQIIDLDRTWTNHPFLTKRKRITSIRQIQELKQYGILEVTIDLGEQEELPPARFEQDRYPLPPMMEEAAQKDDDWARRPGLPSSMEIPLEKEIRAAANIRKEACWVVRGCLEDIRMGKSLETGRVRQVVDQMVESVLRNRDALVSLTRIKGHDEYTFVHSINVCILTITLGRHLELSTEELRQIGLGGLLHDAGKTKIPASVLNRPGKVTKEEFEEIKKHPIYTLEYLDQAENIPPSSKIVGLEHHERCNAQGYPYGLSEGEISLFGQIAAIADVYDAVTSDRCYKAALLPWEAVRMMYVCARKGDFNLGLTARFIQCMGIFPVGSIVQLKTGEVGIVHSLNHDRLLLPRVLLIYKDLTRPYPEPLLVDLTEDSKESSPSRSISRPLTPAQLNVDPNQYLFGHQCQCV
jgi:HD-GYP domain-containing protein (c-di-GMP phosphodiesterase class II)